MITAIAARCTLTNYGLQHETFHWKSGHDREIFSDGTVVWRSSELDITTGDWTVLGLELLEIVDNALNK